MALHRFVEPVIGAACQWRPGFGIDRLQPGDRMRQDLQIDAGLIHLANAQRAEIVEPLDDLATRPGTPGERLDLRVLVMFFERNNVGLLCHSSPPSIPASSRPIRPRRRSSLRCCRPWRCNRNIEMTPLCNLEMTLPRIGGSRGPS